VIYNIIIGGAINLIYKQEERITSKFAELKIIL
jgi:hypothetical protein